MEPQFIVNTLQFEIIIVITYKNQFNAGGLR